MTTTKDYRALSRFVLRTPVLPFDVIAKWDGSREKLLELVAKRRA